MTPEGIIKQKVNKLLDSYKPLVYRFMPVPTGFGKKTLDYLICVEGRFVAIETKAPGKKPTALQRQAIAEIEAAYGVVFVIDGPLGLAELRLFLEKAVTHGGRSSIPETQDRCSAV